MCVKRSWHEANTSSLDDDSINNPNPDGSHVRMNGTSSPSAGSTITAVAAGGPRRDSVDARPHPSSTAQPPTGLQQIEISRKVKACAACRKQKIRCHMDQGNPPCRRCKERNLSCVLSKSLQMLMDERSQWHQDIVADIELLYQGVQQMRDQSGLPALPPLRSSLDRPGPDGLPPSGNMTALDHHQQQQSQHSQHGGGGGLGVDLLAAAAAAAHGQEEVGPSTDNSPRLAAQADEGMPDVPMQSVYYLTKLRALRGTDAAASHPSHGPNGINGAAGGVADSGGYANGISGTDPNSIRDFISEGQIPLADAQKLFDLYVDRLDHFIYRIGGRWRSLHDLRTHSPVLTACVMTVAAMHDGGSNHLYPVCNREFRRLVAGAVFDRRIDRDHLRALCVASYWLSDVAWTLSGVAIRRATEVNLVGSYQRVLEHSQNITTGAGSVRGNQIESHPRPGSGSGATGTATAETESAEAATAAAQDAADCMRLWYYLYICDKHLSILYGRPSLVREDFSVQGWEDFLASPVATDDDRRLISQVALHIILTGVHELFGPDAGAPVPLVYSTQIASFSRQLDHWIGYWSTALKKHFEAIGEFPAKGALIHYHFAKLYLFSHVFRGLSAAEPVPAVFRSAASGAVAAATAIVELLLTDTDIREGLRGMPSYLLAMTAFACVFLLKIATGRPQDGLVDVSLVRDLTGRLVGQFRSVSVGRWHLVHLMADGLEKSAASLLQTTLHHPNGTTTTTAAMDSHDGGGGGGPELVAGESGGGITGFSGGGAPSYPDPTALNGDHHLGGGSAGGMPETPLVFNNLSPDFVFGATSFLDFNGGAGSLDFNYDHLHFP